MKIRSAFIIALLILIIIVGLAGIRGMKFSRPPFEIFSDMVRQQKTRPQTKAALPDGRELKPVSGTVPMGKIIGDNAYLTGLIPGTTNYVDIIPIEVDKNLLQRGRQRYNIFCSHCHGVLGDANTVARRIGAMPVGTSLYEKRIARMQDGEIFNVITYGRNLMNAHGAMISVTDRWAIVSYVRALQFSRMGTIDDVPPQDRDALCRAELK